MGTEGAAGLPSLAVPPQGQSHPSEMPASPSGSEGGSSMASQPSRRTLDASLLRLHSPTCWRLPDAEPHHPQPALDCCSPEFLVPPVWGCFRCHITGWNGEKHPYFFLGLTVNLNLSYWVISLLSLNLGFSQFVTRRFSLTFPAFLG